MSDPIIAEQPIKIDKGVPIPVRRNLTPLPWKTFEVGGSFLLPPGRSHNNVYAQAKARGFEITTRREPGGIRVWRTA